MHPYAQTCGEHHRSGQRLAVAASRSRPTTTDDLGTTFQSVFFRPNPALLSWEALRRRRQVIDFLNEHGIPLDPKAVRVP